MYSRPSNDALWPLPPNALGTDRVLVAANTVEPALATIATVQNQRIATTSGRHHIPVWTRTSTVHAAACSADQPALDPGSSARPVSGVVDAVSRSRHHGAEGVGANAPGTALDACPTANSVRLTS